jgi:hypothetical protein
VGAQDPATLRLLVLTSLEGSPAARAGVKPGDEVRAARCMRQCVPCVIMSTRLDSSEAAHILATRF